VNTREYCPMAWISEESTATEKPTATIRQPFVETVDVDIKTVGIEGETVDVEV
jgi:hypothetical protein